MNDRKRLKKRHKLILQAFDELGGETTTRLIASGLNISVNGVAQSIRVLGAYLTYVDGEEGDRRWKRTALSWQSTSIKHINKPSDDEDMRASVTAAFPHLCL